MMQSHSYLAHLHVERDDAEMPVLGAAPMCSWEQYLPQSLRSHVAGVTPPSWDACIGTLRHSGHCMTAVGTGSTCPTVCLAPISSHKLAAKLRAAYLYLLVTALARTL